VCVCEQVRVSSPLTSLILAELKEGVRTLRTLFQCSFFSISRQSLMGLVAERMV